MRWEWSSISSTRPPPSCPRSKSRTMPQARPPEPAPLYIGVYAEYLESGTSQVYTQSGNLIGLCKALDILAAVDQGGWVCDFLELDHLVASVRHSLGSGRATSTSI